MKFNLKVAFVIGLVLALCVAQEQELEKGCTFEITEIGEDVLLLELCVRENIADEARALHKDLFKTALREIAKEYRIKSIEVYEDLHIADWALWDGNFWCSKWLVFVKKN